MRFQLSHTISSLGELSLCRGTEFQAVPSYSIPTCSTECWDGTQDPVPLSASGVRSAFLDNRHQLSFSSSRQRWLASAVWYVAPDIRPNWVTKSELETDRQTREHLEAEVDEVPTVSMQPSSVSTSRPRRRRWRRARAVAGECQQQMTRRRRCRRQKEPRTSALHNVDYGNVSTAL